MMRSTFAGSIAITTGLRLHDDVAAGERLEALDRAPRERPHVGHPVLRLHDAAVQAVDVEQVA